MSGRILHQSARIFALRDLALVFVCAVVPITVWGKNSCPLTDAQSQKAVTAWAPIASFLTGEPRCVNCHGRVNPYIDGVGLDPNDPFKDPEAPVSQIEHGGGKQQHEGTGLMDQGCKSCHDDMAPKRDGSPSVNWTLAPNFLSFIGKDAATLCRQIKRATGSADGFLGHLQDDNGGTNFAGTAFLGNRGLDDATLEGMNVTIEKPSLTHEAVMKLGQDWVDAMGGQFQGDDSCGCELTHALWSGQIHYARQLAGDEGHNALQEWSNTSMTTITINVDNGVGTVDGHYEHKSLGENRHPVAVGGGRVSIQPEGGESSEGGGSGTYPATVEVGINEAKHTYDIRIAPKMNPDGTPPSDMSKPIGKEHWVNCIHADCKSGDSDIGVPSLPPLDPLSGPVKDPNHVQGSIMLRRENIGRAHNGVIVETMTIDLWRSGSE